MPVADDPLLTFNAAIHEYRYNGVVKRSVTQYLDAMGAYDFGGANDFQLRQARERGSLVHQLIELDWPGDLDEESVDPNLAGYLEAARRARVELAMVAAEIEHIVYHYTYQYAGTRDFLGSIQGKDAILDWKTGYLQRATGPQTAGYAACRKDTIKLPRFGCYLQADGRYELVPYKDRNDFTVFLAAVNWTNWHRAGPLSRSVSIGVSHA
jgi:hypothetical protein